MNTEASENPEVPDKIRIGMSASWPSALNTANMKKGQTISHWIRLANDVDKSIPQQIVSCNTVFGAPD
jgi:hypothetical protein